VPDSTGLRFFDCNTFIGRPTVRGHWEPVTAEGLVAEMDRADISKALVWHIAQRDTYPLLGNDLLTEAVASHRDRLIPCWSILPTQTDEMGGLEGWLERAQDAGVKAFRVWPAQGRFLMRPETLGDMLCQLVKRRAPLIFTVASDQDWRDLYDLLRAFPDLRAIVSYTSPWAADRYFRPIVDAYPHVYVEISAYFPPGGIESFASRYGPDRMLFGTGFPEAYHGAMMMMVAHAGISDSGKQAIASGNLERLVREVQQ